MSWSHTNHTVLVVKADVIYFNVFTIKHMNKPTYCVWGWEQGGAGGLSRRTQDSLTSVSRSEGLR